MKQSLLLTLAAVLFSANTFAFTSCESKEVSGNRPLFTISVYETEQIKALVIDQRISKLPLSFLCQKATLTHDGDKLAAYECLGGGFGQEIPMALYVNETELKANYLFGNEEQDLDFEDLDCSIE